MQASGIDPMLADHIFVYGTLKQRFSHKMHRHLQAHASYVAEGSFQGQLYQIDWYPGAIESNDTQNRIIGEIYQIKHPDILLPRLDKFEGYQPSNPSRSEYIRAVRPIQASTFGTLNCYIYLYNFPINHAPLIPSGVFV